MRMPAVFLGHGNPMLALGGNEFSRAWRALGARLPRPRAILCISAHWETAGRRVTAMPEPRTIHDFYGFPPELFAVRYPAPGAPELAARIADLLPGTVGDLDWGLDHGTWAPLRHVYPQADLPVVQLSLDRGSDPPAQLALARKLAPLREEGVLVVGSGNLVHNLRRAKWGGGEPYAWALAFDAAVAQALADDDGAALADYASLHPQALLAVPTPEHYLPMLYVQGVRHPGDRLEFFNEAIDLGSIGMRSFVLN